MFEWARGFIERGLVDWGGFVSASPRSRDGLPPKVERTLKRGPSEQDATSRIEVCLGGLPLLLRTIASVFEWARASLGAALLMALLPCFFGLSCYGSRRIRTIASVFAAIE